MENEISNIETNKKNGSFSFVYKGKKYSCDYPLYILKSEECAILELYFVKKIFHILDDIIEKDSSLKKRMSFGVNRLNELARYFMTLEELNKSLGSR